MQINVTFRHMEHSNELKDYIQDRFSRLKKYSDSPMNVNVVLTAEKFRKTAEVVITGDGIRAAAKQEHDDLRAAVDLVLDKIERQLKKFREKVKSRRTSAQNVAPAPPLTAQEAEEGDQDQVITIQKINPKPMSIEEAADQLQITGKGFLAFINAETNRVNVIYWRKDGGLGLLEP
ncbi:MAG: ribosome-associated translation inhibitor RaiA [Thermodesulfobacteria bacterium]|nr:ribosome-associated translation inhibitor RaiA [Thermodesulfobacteriota bacterium]